MRVALISLVALMLLAPSEALAALGTGQTPIDICVVNTVTATVCNAGFGNKVFFGAYNLAATAQAHNIVCYDNAIAASGQVVASLPVLGAGVSGIYSLPAGGVHLKFGLTCIADGSVTTGVAILTQ